MMDVLVFAALAVLIGLVSIYGRTATMRAAGFAGFVVGILLLWYAALGLPRPQYLHVPHGTVLGYQLDQPRAIYLWLMPDGSAQPLALQLPWREDVASNLVDVARHRGEGGDSLKMKTGRGLMGLPTKPVFYLTHAQALPPKPSGRQPSLSGF
jgi:hypothetical protein